MGDLSPNLDKYALTGGVIWFLEPILVFTPHTPSSLLNGRTFRNTKSRTGLWVQA